MVYKVQYDENKLALRLAKGHLTKCISKLDEGYKDMARVPEERPKASKFWVTAKVIEALSIASEKSIEVRKSREKWMASVMAYNPTEFA